MGDNSQLESHKEIERLILMTQENLDQKLTDVRKVIATRPADREKAVNQLREMAEWCGEVYQTLIRAGQVETAAVIRRYNLVAGKSLDMLEEFIEQSRGDPTKADAVLDRLERFNDNYIKLTKVVIEAYKSGFFPGGATFEQNNFINTGGGSVGVGATPPANALHADTLRLLGSARQVQDSRQEHSEDHSVGVEQCPASVPDGDDGAGVGRKTRKAVVAKKPKTRAVNAG